MINSPFTGLFDSERSGETEFKPARDRNAASQGYATTGNAMHIENGPEISKTKSGGTSGKPRRKLTLFNWPEKVRRFGKDDEGVTAVEFAILAAPFFFLLMTIIETSLMFFAGQVLESSVDDVARRIRTGQLDETLTQAQLRTEICNASAVLFDCDDLNIDLQVVATFSDLGDMPEPDGGALDPGDFGFTAPGSERIVMVTVMSEWPIFTNYVQGYLSDLSNGNALLTAVAAFRTEPF